MAKDIDYIFQDIVGGSGFWQWTRLLALLPTYLPMGLPLLLHLFTAYTPKHRCFIDGCDIEGNQRFSQPFLEFSIPTDHGGSNFLSDSLDYDPCVMYARIPITPNKTTDSVTCLKEDFGKKLRKCTGFVYVRDEFKETLTTELDLVCDHVDKRHLLGSVMMLGLTMGSFFGGPLGDSFGRKTALFGGMCVAVPSIFLGAVVQSYWPYVILRLISCTVIVFGWIAGHNFQVEYFHKSKRRFAYGVASVLGHLTGFVLPLIVYFHRHWRAMHFWTGVACLIGFPVYFVIPESPRWLICNGRESEAEELFYEIARKNGKYITEKQKQEISEIVHQTAKDAKIRQSRQKLSLKHLFGPKFLRRTLILFLCWICAMVTMYALILNVEALSGDIFWNFILGGLMDIPAHFTVFLIVDCLGRRKLLCSLLLLLSLTCFTMAVVPKDMSKLVLLVYLVGKFASSACASLVWLFTSELYPTNLRSQAMGTCSSIARVFGMSSSFISELAVLWPPLPMIILGIPAFVASLLALNLPDTTGKPLPETVDEAVQLETFMHETGLELDAMQDIEDDMEELLIQDQIEKQSLL